MTPALWLGPFAGHNRLDELRMVGITHILNVSETPCELTPADGPFAEIVQHPLADDRRLPEERALAALDTLHRMVSVPESVVYVHCVAGWIRSPTILWLYLFACGGDGLVTARAIRRRHTRARPGHEDLIDPALVGMVHEHGRRYYLPHPRPEALVFAG
jgi:hypothetical protein